MFYAHFLWVSIKKVVGEPVAIVIDLENGIEIHAHYNRACRVGQIRPGFTCIRVMESKVWRPKGTAQDPKHPSMC